MNEKFSKLLEKLQSDLRFESGFLLEMNQIEAAVFTAAVNTSLDVPGYTPKQVAERRDALIGHLESRQKKIAEIKEEIECLEQLRAHKLDCPECQGSGVSFGETCLTCGGHGQAARDLS